MATQRQKFDEALGALRAAIKSATDGAVTLSLKHAAQLEDDLREMDRHLPDFLDEEYDEDEGA